MRRILKKMKGISILHSLKARILILMLVIGIVPSVIMRFGIVGNYESRAVSVRISDVQAQMKIIANHLITYNYLKDTASEVINAELDQLSSLYDGRVLIIGGNFKIIKDTYGISEGKTVISEEVIQGFKDAKSATNYDRNNGYIEMTIPITENAGTGTTVGGKEQKDDRKDNQVKGIMLVSVSTDSIALTMDILKRKAVILEILMMIVISCIAVLLTKLLVKPFERVTQAINEVKEGFTNEPIAVSDYTETEHIMNAFNQLLTRMKTLDASRQEFVSNVSHELKTPLTSMKVLADSLNAQENVPVELYREFMQDIGEEIDRENKIINDLLSMVKMEKSATELTITTVDINALVEVILKRLRPIARKQNVEVVFESRRQVSADVDEVKLSLVISNLVENAIKYNKEHGWVKVLLDADHQFFLLEVSDSGIGIPEEERGHIYERFYRVDKSHSREIGGTGLGLAIARSAVLLHRGSIQVSSIEGEGTCFTVKIPLSYIK